MNPHLLFIHDPPPYSMRRPNARGSASALVCLLRSRGDLVSLAPLQMILMTPKPTSDDRVPFPRATLFPTHRFFKAWSLTEYHFFSNGVPHTR